MTSFISPDCDALLTREQTASTLTAAGYPTKAKTLATKATRGGGPPYRTYSGRALYRWGDALGWAQSQARPDRTQHVGAPTGQSYGMKDHSNQKPIQPAETAHGLQTIERFSQLLTIKDSSELHAWQTSSRYTIYIEPVGKGRYFVRCNDQNEDVLLISRQPLLDLRGPF